MNAPLDSHAVERADEDDQRVLERITLFSDGVIAIAITLLVLDIHLPDVPLGSGSALRDALVDLGPKYFAYVLSFLVVGSFWIGHLQKFRLIRRYDAGLIWLNLLFLMTIGFVPFASSVLARHAGATGEAFYDGTMLVAGLLSAATWLYASSGDRLIDADLDPALRRRSLLAPVKIAVVFALALILTIAAPHFSRWVWLLLVPAAFERSHRAPRARANRTN